MANTPFIFARQNEAKNFDFSFWGGIEGFLEASKVGGGGDDAALKRLVPDVAKAVDMTAAAISGLPFDILNEKDDIIDSSTNWQNKAGGMPNPQKTLYLVASSLCGGSAYLLPTRTPRLIFSLQYCAPGSIQPFIDSNGLQWFQRNTQQGKSETVYPNKMIYFWLPDSDVEIGPALNHPLQNCRLDAQTVYALKETIRKFGERNFAPLTLLGVKGNIAPAEREKTENFFDRLLRFGFREKAKVVNTDALSIEQLSAGMEELKQSYLELRMDAKESIADAFGIPPAMFMADKAYASEMDVLTRQWYKASRFVILYQTIEETFSEQLFKQYKLKMRFNLDSLDVFQEDESSRAASLGSFVSAVDTSPETAKLGMSILGYDLDKDQEAALDELIRVKEEAREKMAEQTNKPPTDGDAPTSPFTDDNPPEDKPEEEDEPKEENPAPKSVTLSADEIKDLALWYDRAKQWNAKGKSPAVDWENKHLPETIAAPIRLRLAEAKSEADISAAFYINETPTTAPVYEAADNTAAIKALAATIEKAIEEARRSE
jgi:HK97 family phage portal protein